MTDEIKAAADFYTDDELCGASIDEEHVHTAFCKGWDACLSHLEQQKRAELAEEDVRFYRNEWENACERAQYAKELQAELAEAKRDLELKSKEIGRSEHRGNTVDYIYDKCANYGRQFDELNAELDRLKGELERLQSIMPKVPLENLARQNWEAGRHVGDIELQKERALSSRYREALEIVAYTDRSRGYPTGKNWTELVKLTNQALEADSAAALKKEGK